MGNKTSRESGSDPCPLPGESLVDLPPEGWMLLGRTQNGTGWSLKTAPNLSQPPSPVLTFS